MVSQAQSLARRARATGSASIAQAAQRAATREGIAVRTKAFKTRKQELERQASVARGPGSRAKIAQEAAIAAAQRQLKTKEVPIRLGVSEVEGGLIARPPPITRGVIEERVRVTTRGPTSGGLFGRVTDIPLEERRARFPAEQAIRPTLASMITTKLKLAPLELKERKVAISEDIKRE